MIRPQARRVWLKLHRWMGLSLGVILLVAAITGTLLVIARPLDEAMHPELFNSSSTGRTALQPVVVRLRAKFGPRAAFNLRLPTQAGRSLQVLVSGPWEGTVYVDASTGMELGRRAAGQGYFNVLFDLHSTLLAGDRGRAVLATAALGYLFMLASGVVLWWPARWKHAFSVRTRSGAALALMDVHRVAGVALGALVMVSVASGAYMAWKPLASWVTYLSGRAPVAPAVLPNATISPVADMDGSVDRAVEHALGHWRDGTVTVVHIPPGATAPSRVRAKLPDDPHPVGMSTALLNQSNSTLRASKRWSELEMGNRAYSVVYPLHTGALYGTTTLVLTFAGGLALLGFGGTGLWLWYSRRARRASPT